jgi:hypothetical protein
VDVVPGQTHVGGRAELAEPESESAGRVIGVLAQLPFATAGDHGQGVPGVSGGSEVGDGEPVRPRRVPLKDHPGILAGGACLALDRPDGP